MVQQLPRQKRETEQLSIRHVSRLSCATAMFLVFILISLGLEDRLLIDFQWHAARNSKKHIQKSSGTNYFNVYNDKTKQNGNNIEQRGFYLIQGVFYMIFPSSTSRNKLHLSRTNNLRIGLLVQTGLLGRRGTNLDGANPSAILCSIISNIQT